MGELLLSSDQFTSFTDFSAGLLGPWAGFFMGWTYWFCWIITCIAEMTAITRYVQFWWPVCPAWVIALSCVVMFLLLNILAVRWFGEIEFWFAMVKILAIVGLIICGLLLISINYSSSTDSVAALHNLWSHGGLFPHWIGGFLEGLQISVFAFVGIELVGAIAAEARQPEKILPKAINHIPIRFIIFYALSVLVILCVIPWDRFSPESSPFVGMFTLIGLPAAAAVLSFVVLTSACSSSNSGVFSTSRMLYGMATQGVASPQFKKLSSHYVPVRGLLFSCFCLSVGVLFIYFVPDVMKVFAILTTIASILFMFIWTMILVCYLV